MTPTRKTLLSLGLLMLFFALLFCVSCSGSEPSKTTSVTTTSLPETSAVTTAATTTTAATITTTTTTATTTAALTTPSTPKETESPVVTHPIPSEAIDFDAEFIAYSEKVCADGKTRDVFEFAIDEEANCFFTLPETHPTNPGANGLALSVPKQLEVAEQQEGSNYPTVTGLYTITYFEALSTDRFYIAVEKFAPEQGRPYYLVVHLLTGSEGTHYPEKTCAFDTKKAVVPIP